MAEDSDLILAATVPECGALLLLKRPVVATPGHENSAGHEKCHEKADRPLVSRR